ncbi:hypothetical protein JYU34_012364 [Plutella xylostella]|uniref:Uncharacterized protein n=1 Tax=Plutella xylostella TaxID=51655 RepID=A0ABQ7QB52_PLUXY|nr:hypothetical protein JYU34_012364 [Plutella xylostella]
MLAYVTDFVLSPLLSVHCDRATAHRQMLESAGFVFRDHPTPPPPPPTCSIVSRESGSGSSAESRES